VVIIQTKSASWWFIECALTEDGQHYQHTDINDSRAIVIDIGGYPTDWLALTIYSFDSFLMSR
jgi:hypothetical protein